MSFNSKLRYSRVRNPYTLEGYFGEYTIHRRIRSQCHPAQWQLRLGDAVISSSPSLRYLGVCGPYTRADETYCVVGYIDGAIPVYKLLRAINHPEKYKLRSRYGHVAVAPTLKKLWERAAPHL